MGKGKKSFIDRKKALTFHLVHRSQHDPLVTDQNAPQRVLLEAQRKAQPEVTTNEVSDPDKRREEQRKYGILYDDDYDYLQHLKKREQNIVWEYVQNPNQVNKEISENKAASVPKLQLPSSVFASEFEEEEGMLNKAAPRSGPRPDWDPDIVAALDDDFNYDDEENLLEDDFVVKAMESADAEEENGSENEEVESSLNDLVTSAGSTDEEELIDRLAPLMRERLFNEVETKSRFTEYSMSSSVIRRNEQLTLLDDRFETFYASYNDAELGDLSMEEIEGNWSQKHPCVLSCLKEFKKSIKFEKYDKEWDKQRLQKYRNADESGTDSSEELTEYEVDDLKEKRWDCESILSTYSNTHNHPKLINEPRRERNSSDDTATSLEPQKIAINLKTGLPVNALRGSDNNHLTVKALSKLEATKESRAGPGSLCDKSLLSTLSILSIRPKEETTEEKRERKRLIRQYRNERRIERKANSQAFKEEKKRQIQIKLNQRNNIQGNKIL